MKSFLLKLPRRINIKYISTDIETTGLNPENCQIIEFAAVLDDLDNQQPIEKLPKFQTYVTHDYYRGEAYALGMHSEIFKMLGQRLKYKDKKFTSVADLMNSFSDFLLKNNYDGKVIAAGKNFQAFDKHFIDKLPNAHIINWHHRSLDPAMLYMSHRDVEPPSMATCLERAQLPAEVSHTALEDALLVVKLLRTGFIQK